MERQVENYGKGPLEAYTAYQKLIKAEVFVSRYFAVIPALARNRRSPTGRVSRLAGGQAGVERINKLVIPVKTGIQRSF